MENGSAGKGVGAAEVGWRAAVERLALRAAIPAEPVIRRVALSSVESLVGFWVLWHAEGGEPGLLRLGVSRATIYRKIKAFREAFGQHPDVFDFPGVTVDPAAYLAAFGVPDELTPLLPEMPRVLALGREEPAKLPR